MENYKEFDGIQRLCSVLYSFELPARHDLTSTCTQALGIPYEWGKRHDHESCKTLLEQLRARLIHLVEVQSMDEQFIITSLVNWIIRKSFLETEDKVSHGDLEFQKVFLKDIEKSLQRPLHLRKDGDSDDDLNEWKRNIQKRIAEWDQRQLESKCILERFRQLAREAYPERYWDFYHSWKDNLNGKTEKR